VESTLETTAVVFILEHQ